MDRSRVRELHYITHISNVASILDQGILSHRLARRRARAHITVANAEIQEVRAAKRVPIGDSSRALHDYANLYVHARNAMLLVLLGSYEGDLTVLAIDSRVLDLDGVVIADRNAAAMIARFDPAMVGIEQLDEAAVYAEWWNDSLGRQAATHGGGPGSRPRPAQPHPPCIRSGRGDEAPAT
jgi:hypothetical protein